MRPDFIITPPFPTSSQAPAPPLPPKLKYPNEVNGDYPNHASDSEPFLGETSLSSAQNASGAAAALLPETHQRPVPPPRRSPPKRVRSRRGDNDARGVVHDDNNDNDASLASQASSLQSTVAPLAEVESDFDATFTPTPQNNAGDAIDMPDDDSHCARPPVFGDASRDEAEGNAEGDDIYMVLEGPCVEESETDFGVEANGQYDQSAGKANLEESRNKHRQYLVSDLLGAWWARLVFLL